MSIPASPIAGFRGSVGPFRGHYRQPHVYARDIHSGAGNCWCGGALGDWIHTEAAPGLPVPDWARAKGYQPCAATDPEGYHCIRPGRPHLGRDHVGPSPDGGKFRRWVATDELWSGRIGMEDTDTADRRRIKPGAITLPEPVPVFAVTRAADDPQSCMVGQLTGLTRAGKELRGSGWVDAALLPPGRRAFPCGLDVRIIGSALTDGEPPVLLVAECELVGLAVYLDAGTAPAWPGCEITLADAPGV